MLRSKLGSSQQEEKVFKFIQGYVASNDEAPTIQEIVRNCGFHSASTVHTVLKNLQLAGRITIKQNIPRGIIVNA